jgi:hypothetical protein
MNFRSKILSSVLMGSLLVGSLGSAAMASQLRSVHDSDTSTVTSVSGLTVKLADGYSYTLPYGTDMSAIRVGKLATVLWHSSGSDRIASVIIAG